MSTLLNLEGLLRPVDNLKGQHEGVVVSNVDPTHRGRLKVKVQGLLEGTTLDTLPWVYPSQGSGGNVDNANHNVPDLYSKVQVTFPTGSIYHPEWDRAMATPQSTPGAFVEDPIADPLPGAPPAADSQSHNLLGLSWSNTATQQPSWVRVNKAQGKVEVYLGDADTLWRMDRDGNVYLHQHGDFHHFVEGDYYTHVKGDRVTHIEGNDRTKVVKDQTSKITGKVGVDVGATYEVKTGGALGLTAGGNIVTQGAQHLHQNGALGTVPDLTSATEADITKLQAALTKINAEVAKLTAQASSLQEQAQAIRTELHSRAQQLTGTTVRA